MIEVDEFHKLSLSKVTHKRISSNGKKFSITTKEIENRQKKTKSLFHEPKHEPRHKEVRLM